MPETAEAENIGQKNERIASTLFPLAGAITVKKALSLPDAAEPAQDAPFPRQKRRTPFCAPQNRGRNMKRRDFLKHSLAAAGGALLAATAQPLSHARAGENSTGGAMNILVLTGSPRKNGNSAILADHFIRGVTEAGHHAERFDAAFHNVHPCTACNSCGMNGPCVFQDDFSFVRERILRADVVAFATPMYYFGMSAQLKAVIDRFYAISSLLHTPKKAVLMMTYANHSARNESPILTHYEVLLEYLGWTDAGRVIAPGVWPAGAVERTPYPGQAYALGKSL